MLDSLFGLQLSIDLGRCSSCITKSQHLQHAARDKDKGQIAIPAATAGSPEDCLFASAAGLRGSPLRGLRVRAAPDCREDGDRERRSNRDARFGSGSFWSKRERFARGSSSAMVYIQCRKIRRANEGEVSNRLSYQRLQEFGGVLVDPRASLA